MASDARKKRPWKKPKEEKGPLEGDLDSVTSLTSRDEKTRDVSILDIIEIDGSILEGGGQILRNAMALSCLLHKPIHVTKIRAGRSKPGLRPQHLTGIRLISEVCQGKLTGDIPGSTDITFVPGTITSGYYMADTQTAGSICLLIQAVLPCVMFAKDQKMKINLRGGTNADMAPPIDYMIKVFKPMAERAGVKFDCSVIRRGFYPKGGGEVILTPVTTGVVSPFQFMDKGDIVDVEIESYTAGVIPLRVSHQMASAAQNLLQKHINCVPIKFNTIRLSEQQAFGNGSGIMITARTSTGCIYGGSANGNKKDPSEKTGRDAAEELLRSLEGNACVDEHLQDQLIILMALANGKSKVKTGPITLHTQTAIYITELLTGVHFNIQSVDGTDDNIIECDGIGFRI